MLRRSARFAPALLALTLAAAPLHAGPPWISIELPANPLNATTRGMFLLVRSYHHGDAMQMPVTGTATGLVNFLNFTFSALLGPVFSWILRSVSGGAARMELRHYQTTFSALLYGVAIAFVLTFLLKETGPASRRAAPANAVNGD